MATELLRGQVELRKRRQDKNISQANLAFALGVRQASVSAWETVPGKVPTEATAVDSLQVLLGIEPKHWEDPEARRARLARLRSLPSR
jgi:transcriptional regulator with XRE-family HTH domain